MMNSPCAMLITPIWPNVRARPSAASRRTDPPLRPLNTCVTRTSIGPPRPGRGAPRPGRGVAGPRRPSAAEASGPRVGREVRVRFDRLARGPVGVDQPVGPDLPDERGLGDVVVVAV